MSFDKLFFGETFFWEKKWMDVFGKSLSSTEKRPWEMVVTCIFGKTVDVDLLFSCFKKRVLGLMHRALYPKRGPPLCTSYSKKSAKKAYKAGRKAAETRISHENSQKSPTPPHENCHNERFLIISTINYIWKVSKVPWQGLSYGYIKTLQDPLPTSCGFPRVYLVNFPLKKHKLVVFSHV